METIESTPVLKAKYTVGERIHMKLYLNDDRACVIYFGNITASKRVKGQLFPDHILYDVELEQAEGDPISITNISHGFIIAGGEEVLNENGRDVTDEEQGEWDTLKLMNDMCEHSLDPDTFEKWVNVREMLRSNRKYLRSFREGL